MSQADPQALAAFDRRLRALQREIARLDRCLAVLRGRGDRLSRWRLLTFALLLAGSAAALLALGPYAFALTLLLLCALFLELVRRHRRVERDIVRFQTWRKLTADQVARMTLDWATIPPETGAEAPADHPFARDLDLVGERSLHRLLDVSTSLEGSALLRDWLLDNAPNREMGLRRQDLVRELARLPGLINRLMMSALLAAGITTSPAAVSRWSGQRLQAWLEADAEKGHLQGVFYILLALVPLNLALLFGALRLGWPPFYLASWVLYAVLTVLMAPRVSAAFRDAPLMNESLRQLEAIFAAFERYSFAHLPALQAFTAPLRTAHGRPVDLLKRTNWLLAGASLRYNPLVAFFLNLLLPWDVFFAGRLLDMKAELRDVLPRWLALWFEFEALAGLATLSRTYPQATFPTLQTGDSKGAPFVAGNLGHPLIPTPQRVGNDYKVEALGSLAIITGSNMAGKSSFLRTLGVNLRLAMCGAPVLADSLTTIPFRVFASITVTDSVTDGFSFFYAEVRRLRGLLEELQRPDDAPLFFLIDEIFRGTNNRERLIGSRAYVQALAGSGGTGAIATHDLELVHLAEGNPRIRNFHFRDDVQDGRMIFDYRLHPGPCPTTNALRIMELAGLPISPA